MKGKIAAFLLLPILILALAVIELADRFQRVGRFLFAAHRDGAPK